MQVTYLDHMGTDLSVVEAARTSYNKGVGDELSPGDRKLLRYLLRHSHTTPFEMCVLKVRVEVPIYVARQWMRHRMGSFNEMSGRYCEMPENVYLPHEWNSQAVENKQGSGGPLTEWPEAKTDFWKGEYVGDTDIQEYLTEMANSEVAASFDLYRGRLELGVSKEQARVNLPLSTMTVFVWKVDLWNLMNFLRLRLDSHAQQEIRMAAEMVYEIAVELWPTSMAAFDDYILNAKKLSAPAYLVIKDLIDPLELAEALDQDTEMDTREKKELLKMFGN